MRGNKVLINTINNRSNRCQPENEKFKNLTWQRINDTHVNDKSV